MVKNTDINMNNKNFAHLHLHNEYSCLDGYGSSKKYISKAKELGFNYIALTNHGNIDGLLQWQRECDKQDIHPILGCEAYIVPDRLVKQKEERGHISILIRNETGYNTLCSILTEANLTGFYHKPRIDYNLLLNSDLSGLIIMTACAGSFLNLPGSEFLLRNLSSRTSVYFEIMPHNIKTQHAIHKTIKTLSKKYPEIPFVATNDCHYIEKDEWEAQEMLLAINSRAKWDDPKRWKFGFKGLHLRTADEMLDAFRKQGDWPEEIVNKAMANTIKIARRCFQFRIPKQEISLPKSQLAKTGASEKGLLDTISKEGYARIFKDNWKRNYIDRYKEEFKLITKKKFERYFLIVYDLINWARENNIAVGPGRGSVGGSLIAFLMGITQVDPIKFNLSFSRFISEDRGDWPDIDIDFEKRYRDKVVEYLKSTYGEYHTCGISTDMKMQSKAAIRDVCRVMEIPAIDTNTFAKSIWQGEHNNNSPVQSSIDNTREGKYFAKKYPKATKLILKMEGQVRQSGAHAAAVVISKEDLTKSNKCVLVRRNKRLVCNWNMQDSEYVGLMKLDVLGLSTLSVLSEAKRLINRKDNPEGFYYHSGFQHRIFLNHMEREIGYNWDQCEQVDFDFNKIQLEDKETFEKISDGKTSGMFQLSGHSCTELCKKMKIHSFEDVVAVVALARPGPADSGMTDEYVARKHGGKWKSKHPIYEEVTRNTYGLLVYQEQVMKIISKVAGLSESVADKIRKIVGKKRNPEEFKPYWEQFLQGCKKEKTLSKKEAEEFWEGLLKWASYGFNRSHSVAYALIAYWTAYIKTHCPKEFYAASLTYGEWNEKSKDTNKHKNSLLSEIRQAGFAIIPPKRKYSNAIEWQFHSKKLYVPFVEIAGIGESGANKCLEPVRQNKIQGFFGDDYNLSAKNETKSDLLLKELKVDKPDEIPSNKILSKYLPHIDLQGEEKEQYPNLIKMLDWFFSEEELDNWLCLDIPKSNMPYGKIQRKRFRLEKQIYQCNRCNLRRQCKKRPVLSSMGLNNVVVLLEAPGENEDKEGKGAIGKAGQLLWDELAKYSYNRRFFHVTNACHCWPSRSKTPSHSEIDLCYKWLQQELEQLECRLILACGNIPRYSLTGEKGGITNLSGTTEWVENIRAWVCWCVHPSAVLRNKNANLEFFQDGIKNFVEKLELLKG
jgi:DNA polymerase-3 subunit alpha